jgi:hypothetical protein
MTTKKMFVFLLILLALSAVIFVTHKVSAPQTTPSPKDEAPATLPPSSEATITYNNATADMITVELPFPGAVTGKTFTVIGKARGPWFFEASFPITVLDEKGMVLARGIAQAKSDWMTTDFVRFEAKIVVPESYIGKAVLVLQKDNPSGLPEKDASISFPFTIEY